MKMIKNNRIVLILSFLCILSVSLMIVSLCKGKDDKADFIPPKFDESAKQGVPTDDEAKLYGWAEIMQDGIPYKTAICGNIRLDGENAFVYLTNYAENNIWLKARIYDDNGKIVAETGLAKAGEYIEKIKFVRAMKDGEKIKLKIMAYEPETYYSAGSVVLNTAVNGGN